MCVTYSIFLKEIFRFIWKYMLNTILVSHLSKLKGVLHSFSLDDVAVSIKISLQEEFLKNL